MDLKGIKKSKYYSKKTIIDGIKFDSKKEAQYYLKLQLWEKLGDIKDLELQKEYELQPSFKIGNRTVRKITYRADFTYITTEDNKLHVIDVKGFRTDVYKLKKKMFEYKYHTEIEEV